MLRKLKRTTRRMGHKLNMIGHRIDIECSVGFDMKHIGCSRNDTFVDIEDIDRLCWTSGNLFARILCTRHRLDGSNCQVIRSNNYCRRLNLPLPYNCLYLIYMIHLLNDISMLKLRYSHLYIVLDPLLYI